MEKQDIDISFGNLRFVCEKEDKKEVIKGLSWNTIQSDGLFMKDSDVIDSIGVGLRTFATIKSELKNHPFIKITRPKEGQARGATCYKFDMPMMMSYIAASSRRLIGHGNGSAKVSLNATDKMIASLGHSCMMSMNADMLASFEVPNSQGIEYHHHDKNAKNIADIFASITSIKARTDKSDGNCGKEKVLLMHMLATKTFKFSNDLLFIRLLADAWHNGILFSDLNFRPKATDDLIHIDGQKIVDSSMIDLQL